MSNSEIQLTITPYTLSALPSEQALVAAGKAVLATLDSWKVGKTFGVSKGHTPYSVRTLWRTKGPQDGAGWYARISEHTPAEGSFDDFWNGLGRDKAVNEQEFIPELHKVTLLRSLSPTQSLWTLLYNFPAPVSPRVFTVLQVTHVQVGNGETPREGWIISVPVDVAEDTTLKAKEEKGVRGRYVSVERITEGKDGKLQWTMATSSTPGGLIPQYITEKSMAGTISKDVLHFLEWMKRKAKIQSSEHPPAPEASEPAATNETT